MDTTWIVSANAGRARIFADEQQGKPLHEVNSMINPGARIRTSDDYTDRLGPTSAGNSIHNTGGALPNKQYEPPQTPEEREAESFAKDIAAYLIQAQRESRFQKLALVAAPKFLGLLRSVIDPQLRPLLELEVNKDYTQLTGQELQAQLLALSQKKEGV